MAQQDYEAMAAALEATGDFRILRRLQHRQHLLPYDGSPTRLGIFLDLETTGLDPAKSEIIEFAMLPFTYALDGRIFEVREPFQGLRQPTIPIPPEITQLTGITDEMVAGKSIDPAEVSAFASGAAIIVAHNAAFDRRFAEQFCDVFTTKPWACSMSQVDWAAEGFEGSRLSYLLAGCGLFHGAHRAVDDCRAGIEILARQLPVSGVPALAKLLEAARKPTHRIWAEGAPYELRDALKARGYRWSDGSDGRPRAWYIDVTEEKRPAELDYLSREIYQSDVEPLVVKLTAYDRFSVRC